MEIKEAIENLEYMISEDCTDHQWDYIEEIDMAISALEKAEHYKSMYEEYDKIRQCLELIIKEKNQIIEQLLKEMAERSKEEVKE